MHNWFLTKIKLERTGDDGSVKKVTESYLVDALSFTEAEARIIKEMEPHVSGEFKVDAIQRKNYAEIIPADWSINLVQAEASKILGENKGVSETADKWFECKVNFLSLDDKGKEKKIASFMLVNANTTSSAEDTLKLVMKDTLTDWELEKIAQTKILEVFRWNADNTD